MKIFSELIFLFQRLHVIRKRYNYNLVVFKTYTIFLFHRIRLAVLSFTWRCSHRRFSVRKGVLRNLVKFKGTGVFLWILWNFEEHLFVQSTSGSCLCLVVQSSTFKFNIQRFTLLSLVSTKRLKAASLFKYVYDLLVDTKR